MKSLTDLFLKIYVNKWIRANSNLLILRERLKKEIPAQYLKKFYKTWLFYHITTRLIHKRKTNKDISILTVKISPTMNCNLSCIGCFAGNYSKTENLSLDLMRKIVTQAKYAGVPSIGIIGGEPLLVPEIFEIFEEFPGTGFYLVTNGILLDETTVKKLQGLPNVITIFSIEGFKNTTDYLRGSGVYDKIMNSMKLMKESKLIFGFSTVVNKENLEEVVSEKFIDEMIECGCYFGGFLPYIPVGSYPRYDVVCNNSEVKSYLAKLDEIVINKPILILKEGYDDGTFLNSGCGAGNTIHITSRGEAEPCNGIEFCTHNINTSSITEILNSDYFKDIRALLKKHGCNCLTINHPEELLKIVNKYKATPTHKSALEHLEEYSKLKINYESSIKFTHKTFYGFH